MRSDLTRLSRRRFIVDTCALTTLAACGAPQVAQTTATPSQPVTDDPLAALRFQADEDQQTWARHLDLARLSNTPQMLALSAGGEDGAFGAGALCGLSQLGTRPDFDVVTGVSTGALIAPMAFLGSSGDDALQHMFLDHNAHDIMRFRGLSAVTSSGLYDTAPLADLIATYTSEPILEAIAQRHDVGARLFIVTTNLATSNAIVWDMGAIARARQYALFRAVIRASSALPGLFSPVRISTEHNGEMVTETHLDGGVQMQVLATPTAAFEVDARGARGGSVYLLINNTLDPAPQQSATSALGISQQAMTAMIRSSAAASVNTARMLCERNGLGFKVASVRSDSGIVYDANDRFSADYMAAMFDHGYNRAATDTLWEA